MNENEKSLEKAFPEIKKSIDRSRQAIFTRSQMEQLIGVNRDDWNLNKRGISTGKIIEYMWEKGQLKEYKFEFPSRKETRYTLGEISDFELAQSLKPNSYLVHRAAMYLNNLIAEPPETIYINVEQPKHHIRNKADLTQVGINRAFKNNSRISNEIAECSGVKVCVVHGQRTDRLGVVEIKGPNNEKLQITNVERTLIDIAVRPIYAGGTKEVLKAYRQAKSSVSIEKLVETLRRMDYVYPYHQAIGFYLEESGDYHESEVQLLKEIPINFDFYLDYKMKETEYSETWKVYYPKDLL